MRCTAIAAGTSHEKKKCDASLYIFGGIDFQVFPSHRTNLQFKSENQSSFLFFRCLNSVRSCRGHRPIRGTKRVTQAVRHKVFQNRLELLLQRMFVFQDGARSDSGFRPTSATLTV